ncbi:M23 family metallopeptidase [uncultured Tateyamaria sp.]|uniref:M23 family metallopeptidase n=1 Tax=uncultured Tateyamaria sp. TaxID=455651 RepID=UPI002608FAAC|nr:M23 family metallopeptidase [uncultured Tateyamaria sp.]
MRAAALAALLFPLAAGSLAARDIILNPPIDCDLGSACFVQQYVDHDPSNQSMDFRCSNLSYDTHQGTDFALQSLEQMRRGVNVIAAAPGTVRATRDGMKDELFTRQSAARISGRECGNGIVVDHGGGWTTQYCHMKRGSLAVKKGDRVRKSTVLGQVGLSGRTQFPHVHLTVRKDGKVVDPFDPDNQVTCGAPSTETLWQNPLPYRPGGILTVGFADAVPKFDRIKQGTAGADSLKPSAPAIVVFGYAFGGRAGDKVRLVIDAPGGQMMDETVTLDKNQAQFFRAVGKKRTTSAWQSGTYLGTVSLLRGNRVINTETATVTVQ